MVPSVITTAPAWITPDAPRRGSVITYAPRMMMVSVIGLAHPCNQLARGREPGRASSARTDLYEVLRKKNRQEQHADHGPLREGPRPAFPPPASHAYQDRENAGLFVYSTGIHYQDPLAEGGPRFESSSLQPARWYGQATRRWHHRRRACRSSVTRVDAHRYSTLVERDGVRLSRSPVTRPSVLCRTIWPTFVVEGSLGLDRGFLG